MQLIEVNDERTANDFIKANAELNSDTPNYIRPLDNEIREVFDKEKNKMSLKVNKLYIFDRWGSLIFFSDDINKGWDGTYQAKGNQVVQQDVFVWKIQLKNTLKESKNLTGTVTLIK